MASQRVQDFAQIVEVKGLRELNAELKKANPEMAKKLQGVNKELVERVAARAKSNFYRTVPGRARSSDRPRRSGRGSANGPGWRPACWAWPPTRSRRTC